MSFLFFVTACEYIFYVKQVHLYGTSLGGFLSQLFAQHRPRRVKSLVLSNTFLDTHKFSAAMPWSSVYVFPSQFTISKVEITWHVYNNLLYDAGIPCFVNEIARCRLPICVIWTLRSKVSVYADILMMSCQGIKSVNS